MKVYFTASIVGKKHHLSDYELIINYLKSLRSEVKSDHIIKTSESEIRTESKNERLAFQKKLDDWIANCDCMVVETSFPSISVGYEISRAVNLGKPVLILYKEGYPPSLLAHFKDEKLICERYTDATLKNIIADFLHFAKNAQDLRFTFFITPKIAKHLDEHSRATHEPKSVYLRHLIEKDMEKNN